MTVARRPLRPISWWWVVFGIAAVGAAIWVSTWWLLAQTHGLHGADRATARLDAIKASRGLSGSPHRRSSPTTCAPATGPTEWPRTSTPKDLSFWPGIDIDLNEATLFRFWAEGITVQNADFMRTCFIGGAG